jgi:hypothetical protein
VLVGGHADFFAVAVVFYAPVANVGDEEEVEASDGKVYYGFAFAVLKARVVGGDDEGVSQKARETFIRGIFFQKREAFLYEFLVDGFRELPSSRGGDYTDRGLGDVTIISSEHMRSTHKSLAVFRV